MTRLREAQWEDYKGIASLRRSLGLSTNPFKDWIRLWRENPVFKELEGNWPIGWVLESDTGHIVGYLGNIPMRYELEGEKLLAAAASSWVVDSKYRSHALGLISKFIHQKIPDFLLDTSATSTAGKAIELFRARKVPTPGYDEVLFWITGYSGFGRSLFLRKKCPLPNVFGPLVGFALRAAESLSGHNFPVEKSTEWRPKTLFSFNDQFDDFWSKIRQQKRKLLVVRDRSTLAWHFEPFFKRNLGWVAVCESGSEMVGYAVFIRRDNPETGLKRVNLADIQILDNAPEVLLSLIETGLKQCREKKIDLLEIIGFEEEKRHILKTLGPWTRRFSHCPFYYLTNKKNLSNLLENPALWDPSITDGDACLY